MKCFDVDFFVARNADVRSQSQYPHVVWRFFVYVGLGLGLLGEMLTRIYHEPAGGKQYVLREQPRPAAKPLP